MRNLSPLLAMHWPLLDIRVPLIAIKVFSPDWNQLPLHCSGNLQPEPATKRERERREMHTSLSFIFQLLVSLANSTLLCSMRFARCSFFFVCPLLYRKTACTFRRLLFLCAMKHGKFSNSQCNEIIVSDEIGSHFGRIISQIIYILNIHILRV